MPETACPRQSGGVVRELQPRRDLAGGHPKEGEISCCVPASSPFDELKQSFSTVFLDRECRSCRDTYRAPRSWGARLISCPAVSVYRQRVLPSTM